MRFGVCDLGALSVPGPVSSESSSSSSESSSIILRMPSGRRAERSCSFCMFLTACFSLPRIQMSPGRCLSAPRSCKIISYIGVYTGFSDSECDLFIVCFDVEFVAGVGPPLFVEGSCALAKLISNTPLKLPAVSSRVVACSTRSISYSGVTNSGAASGASVVFSCGFRDMQSLISMYLPLRYSIANWCSLSLITQRPSLPLGSFRFMR